MLIVTAITLILGGFLLPLFIIFLTTDESFHFMMFSGPVLLLLGIVLYCKINGAFAGKKNNIFFATTAAMLLLWLLMRGTDYHPISAIFYAGSAIISGKLWTIIKLRLRRE